MAEDVTVRSHNEGAIAFYLPAKKRKPYILKLSVHSGYVLLVKCVKK